MNKIKPIINTGSVPKTLLQLNVLVAVIYFSWWLIPLHVGNPILYGLLFAGEIYHVLLALTFWYAIWPRKQRQHMVSKVQPSVDIFITVTGEPVEIVSKTIAAAKSIQYQDKHIYILNDGLVAKKDNWKEIESLAFAMEVGCITRIKPGGAKAGNLNHALKITKSEIVVVFDADMQASPDFLSKTIPYFSSPKIGFVQTPQYYSNFMENDITSSSWDQQEFFFGPIMRGKDQYNSAFICGTNVAIRRTALEEVRGFREDNIAEDLLTSLDIHKHGWESVYIPTVLAQGLAPQDLMSYVKQQTRWARGSLELLFSQNPFFKRGLSFSQRIHYLSSALYYLNGLVVLIDIIMPLIYLFTGIEPVSETTTSFALFFIPFMFLSLYTISQASNGAISFRAISFSISSWYLQLRALFSVITGQKMGFSVTPKQAQSGNYTSMAYPHLAYVFFAAVGSVVALSRESINPAVATNIIWVVFNTALFIPFIDAATQTNKQTEQIPRILTSVG